MAKLYKDEVLDKQVEILFVVDDRPSRIPFRGTIRKVEISSSKRGEREVLHYICFEDGDHRWFDLTIEESMNRLKWVDKSEATPIAPHVVPPRPVLPTWTALSHAMSVTNVSTMAPAHSAPTNTIPGTESVSYGNRSSSRKRQMTDRFGFHTDNNDEDYRYDSDSDDSLSYDSDNLVYHKKNLGRDKFTFCLATETVEWYKDMYQFLITVPHGPRKNAVSEHKAKTVMRQVKLLVAGEGLLHEESGMYFYGGIKVTLDSDFPSMLREASQFEQSYDLLRYPIQKLQCYKDFVERKNG